MGYPYPGGPHIDKLAQEGDAEAVAFPHAMGGEHNFDFSFSGLKSAVINYLHTAQMKGEAVSHEDTAASFQKAVTDVLTEKTMAAADKTGMKTIALAGGVAANTGLRKALAEACVERGLRLCPSRPRFMYRQRGYDWLPGLTTWHRKENLRRLHSMRIPRLPFSFSR